MGATWPMQSKVQRIDRWRARVVACDNTKRHSSHAMHLRHAFLVPSVNEDDGTESYRANSPLEVRERYTAGQLLVYAWALHIVELPSPRRDFLKYIFSCRHMLG